MAGLLDALFPASDGGGLLDFLKRNAQMQAMPSGLPSDQADYGAPAAPGPMAAPQQAAVGQPIPLDNARWPFGPIGAPSQANAAMPAPAPAAPAAAIPAAPAAPSPGLGDHLMAGYQNFRHGGGLIGSLVAGVTGQRNDDKAVAAQQAAQAQNLTVRSLIAKGVAPERAFAAVQPGNGEMLKTLVAQHFGGPKAPTVIGNGYVWRPETGKIERAYEPEGKAPTTLGEGYIWNNGKVERAYTPESKTAKVEDEIAARESALKARGIDPKDPKHQQYVLTGKYPREDAQPLSAADKKAIMAAEDDNAVLVGTLDTLRRAKELNTKTFTGATAAARGWVGTAVPGASAIIDQEAAKATREFNQLMSGEAIKSMSETLKGATTDREMARFLEMLADPSTPPDIRERTINRMIQLAERQQKINDSRINDLRGGTYYKPGQANAPAAQAPSGSYTWTPNGGLSPK